MFGTRFLSDSIDTWHVVGSITMSRLGKLNRPEHLLRWKRKLAKLISLPKPFKSFLKKLQSLKMFFETWSNVSTFAFLRVLTLFVCSLIGATIKIPLQGK